MYFLLDRNYKVIASSEVPRFNVSGFMIVKASSEELLPELLRSVVNPQIKKVHNFDTSRLTDSLKAQSLRLYEKKLWNNLYHTLEAASVYKLCCGGTIEVFKADFEKAMNDGIFGLVP